MSSVVDTTAMPDNNNDSGDVDIEQWCEWVRRGRDPHKAAAEELEVK